MSNGCELASKVNSCPPIQTVFNIFHMKLIEDFLRKDENDQLTQNANDFTKS